MCGSGCGALRVSSQYEAHIFAYFLVEWVIIHVIRLDILTNPIIVFHAA